MGTEKDLLNTFDIGVQSRLNLILTAPPIGVALVSRSNASLSASVASRIGGVGQ
jgi:hypothetical protein